MEKKFPSKQGVLAALIPRVRCSQAASNENSKSKSLKCLYLLVPKALAVVLPFLPYPKLESVLLYAAVLVLENILKLQLGLGSVHDVNEAYKSVSIKLAKAVSEM